MQCYNHPRVNVTLTTDWAQYAVPFSAASGGSARVGKVIQEIAWLSPDAVWDFSLDEIAFYEGTPPSGALTMGSGGIGGSPVSGGGFGPTNSGSGTATGGTGGGATSNGPTPEGGSNATYGGASDADSHGGCAVVGARKEDRSLAVAIGALLGWGVRRRRARR
jgi:hypothetical protein